VVVQIIRYGGGRVLALSHPMQRHLRNLLAARQHVYVSEENLAGTGATLVPWPTTIRDRGRRA
jgi:hypothetical protein